MVAPDHGERDLDVERLAANAVVSAGPVEERIDPSRTLRDGPAAPVGAQTDRHSEPEVCTVRIGQAGPQPGTNVVGLQIEPVERGERRSVTAASSASRSRSSAYSRMVSCSR